MVVSKLQIETDMSQYNAKCSCRPPEQMAELMSVTLKADMWAFACTLIHMLSGVMPMAGLNLVSIVSKVCPLGLGGEGGGRREHGEAVKHVSM